MKGKQREEIERRIEEHDEWGLRGLIERGDEGVDEGEKDRPRTE